MVRYLNGNMGQVHAHAHCYPETRQEAPPKLHGTRNRQGKPAAGSRTYSVSADNFLLQIGENGNGDAWNAARDWIVDVAAR